MTTLFQGIFGIILATICIDLNGQEYLMIVIGEIESIKFDRLAYEHQELEDSLAFANGTWSHDTSENGTVISTSPPVRVRMANPYSLLVNVKKSFSTTVQAEQIIVRIWEHENPELILNKQRQFAFLLANPDSNDVYPTFDYYRVFRTWTGKWVEPVGTRNKKYPKAKKAFFSYELLKQSKTKYYQLITDELDCCKDQLQVLYRIKKEI